MATEEYSVGYEAGYQDGWNAAIDKTSQRTWVGLTQAEVEKAEDGCWFWDDFDIFEFANRLEALLKEKNT